MILGTPLTSYTEYEHENGACPDCGEPARRRTCAGCGFSAMVIDCGHMPQPRPISAGLYDGSRLDSDFCEACECGELAGPEDRCRGCGGQLEYQLDVFCASCGGPER